MREEGLLDRREFTILRYERRTGGCGDRRGRVRGNEQGEEEEVVTHGVPSPDHGEEKG